jgi:UDP-N-acetylglucosamine 4,6-dehydratase (inverting)
LITGGTGSFGQKLTETLCRQWKPRKIIVYSRDEYKQYEMENRFMPHKNLLRFFLGDVRDRQRLYRALEGVDILIHAAALKQVPALEYNPIEAVRTNIHGAENVIDAAIDRGVKKVVALSTDKAVYPVNLYGSTKMVSDRLFLAANAYVGTKNTSFSVVRYGNVVGSRGSVVPFFLSQVNLGAEKLPITDFRMTRFWITLTQSVEMVIKAVRVGRGAEIFVPRIPSVKIVDVAKALEKKIELEEVGIREGEKLHEFLITEEEARTTYDYGDHFVIYPHFKWWNLETHFIQGGTKVDDGFVYASHTNSEWLTVSDINRLLNEENLLHDGTG